MKLIDINNDSFDKMLKLHADNGGDLINASLSKMFDCLNDETSKYEVQTKVAALNQLYSTAIQYITPVVKKIVREVPKNQKYSSLVDKIATVKWKNSTTGKTYSRCNLSFASKYIHFLSKYEIPIYDSYIWIVMIGYLRQKGLAYSFNPPANYNKFYEKFIEFIDQYNLQQRSTYDIDKFLWQYGKKMLKKIMSKQKVKLEKAKSILKKRLKVKTNK